MRSPSYAWGCSLLIIKTRLATLVCPTHMGIYLHPEQLRKLHLRLPHMRGDLPGLYTGSLNGFPATHMRGDLLALRRSTLTRNWAAPPYAWGCTPQGAHLAYRQYSCLTCVGIYLTFGRRRSRKLGLPHVRGDVPGAPAFTAFSCPPAPQTRGCTCAAPLPPDVEVEFAPHVGIYLKSHLDLMK
jgi:hypothetical protein